MKKQPIYPGGDDTSTGPYTPENRAVVISGLGFYALISDLEVN